MIANERGLQEVLLLHVRLVSPHIIDPFTPNRTHRAGAAGKRQASDQRGALEVRITLACVHA
jgi:hypothetical protein